MTGASQQTSARPQGAPALLHAHVLSPLVQEILHFMRDPGASVARLSAVVAADRNLSERFLSIANSPSLALPRRVSSLSGAITLLGFDALRDTVLRMVVNGAFRSLVDLFTSYEEFWNHSISCGIAARIIARQHPPVSEEDAFVAGLFHDLGMIVPLGSGEHEMTDARGDTAAGSHEEIGAWLAEHWGLGTHIQETIRLHHRPTAATLDPRLTAVVHIADILCRRLDIGRYAADPDTEFDPGALRLLGIRAETLSAGHLAEATRSIMAGMAEAPGFASLVASVKHSLVESIGGLPYPERLTLALCYQEGLSDEEVAHLLGNTTSEVSFHHDRALARLSATIRDCV